MLLSGPVAARGFGQREPPGPLQAGNNNHCLANPTDSNQHQCRSLWIQVKNGLQAAPAVEFADMLPVCLLHVKQISPIASFAGIYAAVQKPVGDVSEKSGNASAYRYTIFDFQLADWFVRGPHWADG